MFNSESYGVDLAYVHDTGYGNFARDAAPSLLGIISQCQSESRLVVDIGCGSGIWARFLADSGYQVTGLDIFDAMIEIARRRVPEGTFHVGSFIDFAIPPYRSITALVSYFCTSTQHAEKFSGRL